MNTNETLCQEVRQLLPEVSPFAIDFNTTLGCLVVIEPDCKLSSVEIHERLEVAGFITREADNIIYFKKGTSLLHSDPAPSVSASFITAAQLREKIKDLPDGAFVVITDKNGDFLLELDCVNTKTYSVQEAPVDPQLINNGDQYLEIYVSA